MDDGHKELVKLRKLVETQNNESIEKSMEFANELQSVTQERDELKEQHRVTEEQIVQKTAEMAEQMTRTTQ
jgi:hypothetical protein